MKKKKNQFGQMMGNMFDMNLALGGMQASKAVFSTPKDPEATLMTGVAVGIGFGVANQTSKAYKKLLKY